MNKKNFFFFFNSSSFICPKRVAKKTYIHYICPQQTTEHTVAKRPTANLLTSVRCPQLSHNQQSAALSPGLLNLHRLRPQQKLYRLYSLIQSRGNSNVRRLSATAKASHVRMQFDDGVGVAGVLILSGLTLTVTWSCDRMQSDQTHKERPHFILRG